MCPKRSVGGLSLWPKTPNCTSSKRAPSSNFATSHSARSVSASFRGTSSRTPATVPRSSSVAPSRASTRPRSSCGWTTRTRPPAVVSRSRTRTTAPTWRSACPRPSEATRSSHSPQMACRPAHRSAIRSAAPRSTTKPSTAGARASSGALRCAKCPRPGSRRGTRPRSPTSAPSPKHPKEIPPCRRPRSPKRRSSRPRSSTSTSVPSPK